MRPQILLISLLCLCFAAPAQEYAPVQSDCDPTNGSWISLEGNNTIQMPLTRFSSPSANWTYPFRAFPIYTENQTISGSILCKAELAGSNARVYISDFSILGLLSALNMLDNETVPVGMGSPIMLNGTGDAPFALEGVRSGLYNIMVVDALNTTVLAATPALIAKGEIAMNSSPQIKAGDMLQLEIETPPAWGNESRIYGAIMISSQDYATAGLSLTANGTEEGLISTITLCNSSIQVQGMPGISTDLLMKILYILPQNSAVAMQESAEQNVELYLFTDPAWDKGEYILTCAVYSPKKGLMGLSQGIVEVV